MQLQSLGWEDPLEGHMAMTPVFLPGEFPRDRGVWQARDHRVRRRWSSLACNMQLVSNAALVSAAQQSESGIVFSL